MQQSRALQDDPVEVSFTFDEVLFLTEHTNNTYDVGQLYVTLEIAVLLACLILNEDRSRQHIRVCTSYWQELL